MNKNKISYTRLLEFVDNHIEAEQNMVVVCDYDLAEFLVGYLDSICDLNEEFIDLNEDCDEFYFTLDFYRDEMEVYCEPARTRMGKYKLHEIDNTDYFIFSDMFQWEVDKYLCGENCTWSRYEIVVDNECDCEGCEGCSCDGVSETCNCAEDMIEKYAEMIYDNHCCPDCIKSILFDMFTETLLNFRVVKKDANINRSNLN